MRKNRGVYEKVPGSGIWWIEFYDANGRRRREKIGRKSDAIMLYQKRKTEVLQGKKLPERLRSKAVSFSELASDTMAYSKSHKVSWRDDDCRLTRIVQDFSSRTAESMTPQEIDCWLTRHEEWTNATKNRYLALFKLTYRLGNENGKLTVNPARLVRQRREDNARIRYLLVDEERRLRVILEAKCPFHLPEFNIALNTGMRRSEQYGLMWPDIDLENRRILIRRSKHGGSRYVRLNHEAVAAFEILRCRGTETSGVFLRQLSDAPLTKTRHWFEDAVRAAGILNFTWHDLRHTFASRLVMTGADLRTVQELMGHKSIQMTCRYARLAPSHQLAAVDRLHFFGQTETGATATTTATDQLQRAAVEVAVAA